MPAEVTREEWIKITATEGCSIFVDPDFLDPVASVFNCQVKYYVNFLKAKPVIGFACFVSGRRVIVPTHFIYSGIWYNIKPETIKFRNALIELIQWLQKEYRSIDFRLPPEVQDIRPFQWNEFSYQVNYTYVRETEELDFEYNVRSRVKKASDLGIIPRVASSFPEVWEHQKYDLKRFNFPEILLRRLEKLFALWLENGYLRIYTAHLDSEINGSSCVLIDTDGSKAYNLLISSANSNYHMGIHASLYNFIFHNLKEQQLQVFDLYGADLRGVADFKSSFGATLCSHYTVRYRSGRARVRALTRGIKLKLIKLRAKLF